jgi:hypothetical protein
VPRQRACRLGAARGEGRGGSNPGDQGHARGVVGLEANRRKKKGGKEGRKKKKEKRKRKGEKRKKEIGKRKIREEK